MYSYKKIEIYLYIQTCNKLLCRGKKTTTTVYLNISPCSGTTIIINHSKFLLISYNLACILAADDVIAVVLTDD